MNKIYRHRYAGHVAVRKKLDGKHCKVDVVNYNEKTGEVGKTTAEDKLAAYSLMSDVPAVA